MDEPVRGKVDGWLEGGMCLSAVSWFQAFSNKKNVYEFLLYFKSKHVTLMDEFCRFYFITSVSASALNHLPQSKKPVQLDLLWQINEWPPSTNMSY